MNGFKSGLADMPRSLLAGIAVVVVLFGAGVWWLLQPSWAVLHQEASDTARAEVTTLLAARQIPFQVGQGGTVEVRQEDLATARALMVEAGLPARAGAGYELFDNADYGMSEFAQKINYQRALEGELARSIMSLREVKAARVHLTLRRNSLYATEREPAKASVVLQLHTGMMLDKKQVAGVQQLVAASVEGLQPEAVVVIDEAGLPLSAARDFGAFDDRWQLTSRIEAELQAKAQQVLDATYGASNAQAAVRVQMNFDRVRAVKELPVSADAQGNAIVVREKQMQTADNRKEAEGGGSTGREQQTDETEYAVGKDHSEIEYSPGRIERITVGVMLSDKLPAVDTRALGELMTATLGLVDQRGDRLSIAVMPMREVTAAGPLGAVPAPLPALPKAGAEAVSPWWLVVGGLLLGAMLTAAFTLRRAAPVQPDASPAQRDALLRDVRAWLADDAGGGRP